MASHHNIDRSFLDRTQIALIIQLKKKKQTLTHALEEKYHQKSGSLEKNICKVLFIQNIQRTPTVHNKTTDNPVRKWTTHWQKMYT